MAADLARIQEQARRDELRLTVHAQDEMLDEAFYLEDVIEAITSDVAQVVEDYPTHQRGACCLLYGQTLAGRDVHVVCTTDRKILIIITVYEPLPPKWVTPTQRGPK
jgi:hypothetical protein